MILNYTINFLVIEGVRSNVPKVLSNENGEILWFDTYPEAKKEDKSRKLTDYIIVNQITENGK